MSFEAGWVFDDLNSVDDLASVFWGYYQQYNITGFDAASTPNGTGKSLYVANGYSGGMFLYMPRTLTNDTYWFQAEILLFAESGWVLGFADEAGNFQGGLYYNGATNLLSVYLGSSTVIATGTTPVATGVFHRIDVKFKIHNTLGLYEVYLNGNPTPYLTVNNVDTQAQATDNVGRLHFNGNGYRWFRPVIFNSQGTKNNGRVPVNFSHKILYPNADGASIWTPNSGSTAYTQIDDLQGSNDDDATYVGTSTLNAKNRCGLTDAASLGTIAALTIHSRFGRNNPGAIAVKSGFISGANEWQSADRYLPANYIGYADIIEYETGTTEFTLTKVNAMEVTAEVTALS